MSIAVQAEHIRRYRDIAWLLWKHGRADWVKASGLEKAVPEDTPTNGRAPETLARDLESLGPTFIKIGQLLASRADLLPPAYLQALSRLQEDVEPVPYADIERVIFDELRARPSRAFSYIDPHPLATASLAQVHAARLRDGRDVVLKVQRPGIEEEIRHDFDAFLAIARLGAQTTYGRKYRVESIVREFRRAIEGELDYLLEAENLRTMRVNLAAFERLRVPAPYPEFSSRRVLTMERFAGASLSKVSPVVFTEVDGESLADELFRAYLQQILFDGFFHADPHPGNVFLLADHRIGLLDLGMVGRINSELQQHLLSLLIAISEGRAQDAAELAQRIGTVTNEFDREQFIDRVSEVVIRYEHSTIRNMEAGRIVLKLQQIAADCGVQIPRALTMVGKTLLNLDGIARCLAPDFNPNEAIRRHTTNLVQRRMRARLAPHNLVHGVLEATELAAQLPKKLNDLVSRLDKTGIRLEVDAFDEQTFVAGFQKVANRITSGLILAALIIGAALLMRVETSFTLFGYPGFAILLFLFAALGGVALLVEIFLGDRRKHE